MDAPNVVAMVTRERVLERLPHELVLRLRVIPSTELADLVRFFPLLQPGSLDISLDDRQGINMLEWCIRRHYLRTVVVHLPPPGMAAAHCVTLRLLNPCSTSKGLGELIESLAARTLTAVPSRQRKVHPKVLRAAALISDQLTEVLSLQRIARHLGTTASHLATLFRRDMGCTFTEYVNRERVERAALLLRQGVSIVTAIDESGFRTAQHFYQQFRRHTGLTPSAFSTNGKAKNR